VVATLGHQAEPGALETIELLMSELVTNALGHCASAIEVAVRIVGERVRVEVWDEDGADRPIVRAVRTGAEHGRGLQLVDSLAAEWGVVHSGPKKAIWFEIASNPSGPARKALR
jgi:anti-sigma regulatory factor (Ser/Thr protein kinase)